jgi:hypothetical protein
MTGYFKKQAMQQADNCVAALAFGLKTWRNTIQSG